MQAEQLTFSRKRAVQRGSTLIEVLIAVLVLSIGLIGALKLQTEGVRLNADSRYSVLASAYAQDALDAITFDRAGDKTEWEKIQSSTSSSGLSGRPSEWMARMVQELPAAIATVTCNPTNRSCSVQIKWTPPGRDQVKADYVIYN